MTNYELAHYKALMEKTAEALKRRRFSVNLCDTKEEARALALALIGTEEVVSWGGSVSVVACGVQEALYERGQSVIDRDKASTPEEMAELMRRALLCDTYLMGTNAISADGQLVNIDRNGNRLAALLYGPRKVIVIASADKIMPDLDAAISRARNLAAPVNVRRFPADVPCKAVGRCVDCTAEECLCCQTVITRLCRPTGRIHVILVAEKLGF